MSDTLDIVGVGRMAYADALHLQRETAAARIDGTLSHDLLLLVEHPPVITLGRGFEPEHLPTAPHDLARRGIEVHEVDRGGDVTYHGPGQLVGYPIFDLQEHTPDLHRFLRQLEAVLLAALTALGVTGRRRDGLTGVWIEDRKVASIGIHVRKWVTWHGFALNVNPDLQAFDLIVPCGITDVTMTSLQHELGERAPRDLWGRACDAVMLGCCEVFGQVPQAVPLELLQERLRAHRAD